MSVFRVEPIPRLRFKIKCALQKSREEPAECGEIFFLWTRRVREVQPMASHPCRRAIFLRCVTIGCVGRDESAFQRRLHPLEKAIRTGLQIDCVANLFLRKETHESESRSGASGTSRMPAVGATDRLRQLRGEQRNFRSSRRIDLIRPTSDPGPFALAGGDQ